ncbi:MAG TPA: FecR domain-containing protein [Sediminibacterium sp.]|nr:FecR domain-containing protein [Sediminibacterium sp.]
MKEEQFWILLSKKLAHEATGEELALLQEFLNSNSEWMAAHDHLQEFCNSRPEPAPDYTQRGEDAYLNHINRLKARVFDFETEAATEADLPAIGRKTRYIRWVKLAGSMAAACVLFYYIFSIPSAGEAGLAQNELPHNEVKVGHGSKSKIQLPDGTQVWLNSGSKLTYEGSFKGGLREVALDGEAYFDVTRDPEHPFIVHTSGVDIKVLGTAFNVKAYDVDQTIEATLIHGSIEVVDRFQPDAPKVMLKPHEKIVFNKSRHGAAPKTGLPVETRPEQPVSTSTILVTPLPKHIADSSILETSWLYNRISFDDEKMTDVAIKLERWYDVRIRITDDKIKNYRISGAFIDETIDEALRDIQLLIPFKYEINNKTITINKK